MIEQEAMKPGMNLGFAKDSLVALRVSAGMVT
jgi:hypothetical protein